MSDPENNVNEALHAWAETSAQVGTRLLQVLYAEPRPEAVIVTRNVEEDGSIRIDIERAEEMEVD